MDNTASDRQIFDYFLIVGAPQLGCSTSLDGREPQAMQVQGYGDDADDEILSPVKADYPGDDRMLFDYNNSSVNTTSFAEESNGSVSTHLQTSSVLSFPPPVGWTLGSPRDPIVDLAVINRSQGEQVPAEFVCIEKTVGRHVADLNAGSISAPSMFLCYRRGRDKPPLMYVDVFCEGQDSLTEMKSMELVKRTHEGRSANVNNSSSRPIYIMFGRAKPTTYNPNELVVADLCVINASRGEVAPHTYFNMHKNLNTSFVGATIHLGFRKALCKRNYFTYKPEVLSAFPNNYVVNGAANSISGGEFRPPSIPLPQEVPLFCLPLGATLESWPREAQMWSGTSKFVLTLSQETTGSEPNNDSTENEKLNENGELPRKLYKAKNTRSCVNKAKPVQKLYGTVKIFYESVSPDELSAKQVQLLTHNAFPWLPENSEYSTRFADKSAVAVGAVEVSGETKLVDENVALGPHDSSDLASPVVKNVINSSSDDDEAADEIDSGCVKLLSGSTHSPERLTSHVFAQTNDAALDEVDAFSKRTETTVDNSGGVKFWRARALCLLSRWPMFDAHTSLLKHLAEMTSSLPPRMYPCPMERYLAYFYCRIPFPTAQRPRVLLQLGTSSAASNSNSEASTTSISISMPTQASALPLSGCLLTQLIHVLSPQSIVRVMLYVLLEQKIVLHSLRPDILTIIAESISAVLFPFIWQCPYVPLCPLTLAHVLHAPVPFIIGIDSRYFDLYRPADDIIAIDLDTESIRFPAAEGNSHAINVADTSSISTAPLTVGGAAEHFLGSLGAVSGGGGTGKESKSLTGSAAASSGGGRSDGGGVVHNPSSKLALRILPQKPLKQLLKKLQEIQGKFKQESANNTILMTAARRRAVAAGNNRNNTELLELTHAIRMRRNQFECELRECFLRFIAYLLKGYRQYLRPMQMSTATPASSHFNPGNFGLIRANSVITSQYSNRNATDTSSLFDVQSFLHSRERAYQPFYEQLVKTQHFCRFIEERSIMSDEEASQAMAFFDQCLDVVEQQSSSDHSSVRLVSMDVLHDRTAFIPPPETSVPADATLRRELFEAEIKAAENNDAVRVVRCPADSSNVLFQYNRLPKLNDELLLLEVVNLTKSTSSAELLHHQPLQRSASSDLRKAATQSEISLAESRRSSTLFAEKSNELSDSPRVELSTLSKARQKSPVLHKSHSLASPLGDYVHDEMLDGIAIRTQYEHKAAQILHENLRRLYYSNANSNSQQSPAASAATPSSGNTGAKEWASLLLTNCYTLWFMYTPSYAAILEHVELSSANLNEENTSGLTQPKDAVLFAYETLIQMMEARLLTAATVTPASNASNNTTAASNSAQVTMIADQVCYRIVMFLCFRYGLERLAYQLLAEDMQKRFNIQPNAVTYGYYNKTVYDTNQKSRQNVYVQENAENKLRIEQSMAMGGNGDTAKRRWIRLRHTFHAVWLFRMGGKEQFRLRQRKIKLQSLDENFVCRKFSPSAAADKDVIDSANDINKLPVKRTNSAALQQQLSSSLSAARRRQSNAASATAIDFSESDKFRSRIGSIVKHSAALNSVAASRRAASGITPPHRQRDVSAGVPENVSEERRKSPPGSFSVIQFVPAAGVLFVGNVLLSNSKSSKVSATAAARRRRMSSSLAAASSYITSPTQRSRAATLSAATDTIYAAQPDKSTANVAAFFPPDDRATLFRLRRQRSTLSRLTSADETRSQQGAHLNTFSGDAGVQSFSALLRARNAAASRAAVERRKRQQQQPPPPKINEIQINDIVAGQNALSVFCQPEDVEEDEIDMMMPRVKTVEISSETAEALTPTPPTSMNEAANFAMTENIVEKSAADSSKNDDAGGDVTNSVPTSAERNGLQVPSLEHANGSLSLPSPAVPALAPPQPASIMGKLNSFFVKGSKSYLSFRKFIPNSVVSAVTAIGTISDDEADDEDTNNNNTLRRARGHPDTNYSLTKSKAPLAPPSTAQQRSHSIAEETRHSVISTTKSTSVTASPAIRMGGSGGVGESSFTSPEKMQFVRSTLNDSLDTAAAAAAAMTSVFGKKLAEIGSALSAGSAGMAYYGDAPSAAGYYFSTFTDNNAAATAAATNSNSSISSSKKKIRGGGGGEQYEESVSFSSTVTVEQHASAKNSLPPASANDFESLPSPSHSSFLRNLATHASTPQLALRHRNESMTEEATKSADNFSLNSITTKSEEDADSITSDEKQQMNSRKTPPSSFKKLLLSTPASSSGLRRAVSGISLGLESGALNFVANSDSNQASLTEQQLMLLTPTNNGNNTTDNAANLPNPIVNVELCTTNQCEKCLSLLYDEEIMSNWQPDESNLNTVCTHCAHVFVPTLHVSVICADAVRFDRLKRLTAVERNAGDDTLWVNFREVLDLPSEIGRNSAEVSSERLPESCNSAEFLPGSTHVDDDADLQNSEYDEDEERFCVQYLSPLVLRKELESVFAREGELCLSWQQPSFHREHHQQHTSSFVAEHAVVFWNLLFYFERLKRPHCLNALLLTTWLQRRLSARTSSEQLPNELFQRRFMPELSHCVQVSLLWDDAGIYYTAAAAVSAAAQGEVGAPQRQMLPLYCCDGLQDEGEIGPGDEKSTDAVNRLSALQLEDHSIAVQANNNHEISKSGSRFVNDILLSIVYRNDLYTPMTFLLRRRRAQNHAEHHRIHANIDEGENLLAALTSSHVPHVSLYRDLLFLLICHLGRENISKTQFDREYRKAYNFLVRNSGVEQEEDDENLIALLMPSDRPPSARAVWCELVFSMFRDLEL